MFLIDRLLFPLYLDKDGGGSQPDKTEAGPGAGENQGNDAPADAGDEKIPARAQALIDKLRAKEKDLEKLLKAEDKRKRDELSETERLKADKDALEKQIAEVTSKANLRLARASVIEAAAKAGFNDPSDAWAMVRDELTIGEDGEVDGLVKALTGLAESKPYLLKGQSGGGNQQQQAAQPAKPPSPGNPGGSGSTLTADDIKKMTPQEIANRWNDPAFQKARQQALKGG